VLPPPTPGQTPPRFVTDMGGTTQLLFRTLHNDIPEITLIWETHFFNQTPRNNLDPDMVWDSTNNISLTNDICHYRPIIPPVNSSTNLFATPPLAQKYPNIQSLPYRVTQQNQ
jgi:hypothetical protein